MINMDAVNREIEAGRAELAASDKAILTLATRKQIWKTMLDPQDDEASYRHRIELKMTCVRHVQHLWGRAFPGDGRVEEMLTLAQELINQQVDVRQAERRAKTFVMDVFDEVDDYNVITQPAVFVADAASHTASSACHRNPDYDTVDDADTDDDELLPDSLETSYSCSGAAAGALNWQPIEKTNVPARRTFWTWYLDEAIPQVLAGGSTGRSLTGAVLCCRVRSFRQGGGTRHQRTAVGPTALPVVVS
ncbi:Imm5 family immunity protein [Actinomyces israelii]|uniref:Imm5 family immunity protein n=1 Tax=Actinomyces israelii TaxID=1659 RepID=UPI0023529043|nr:Imm5 family immunity protein [Actinomyces israelii]